MQILTEIDGKKEYCGVAKVGDTYVVCAIPASQMRTSCDFTVGIVIAVVFAILTLIIAYAIFLMQEQEKHPDQIEKHYPDGSKFIIFPNGTKRRVSKNGREENYKADGIVGKNDAKMYDIEENISKSNIEDESDLGGKNKNVFMSYLDIEHELTKIFQKVNCTICLQIKFILVKLSIKIKFMMVNMRQLFQMEFLRKFKNYCMKTKLIKLAEQNVLQTHCSPA